MNPIPAGEVGDKLITGSYTRAWNIGHAVLQSSLRKEKPVNALLKAVEGSRLLTEGKVHAWYVT